MSSLSVPEPVIVGRVEVSIVFSAASSISDVVRPMVVIEPIWADDEMALLIATTPCPTGGAATPAPLVAADVTAEVALSPVLTGRPAITTSSPRVPPNPAPAVGAPKALDPPTLTEVSRPLGADDSEGADDDKAAPTPPEVGALAALAPKPPNTEADEAAPVDALLPAAPAPMLMTASTPAVSCSVSPLLPDSITSLPLAALMLPG